MSSEIIILTRKQKEDLKPLFKEVGKACTKGAKGIILAHVLENCMECKFIDHKTAVKLNVILLKDGY